MSGGIEEIMVSRLPVDPVAILTDDRLDALADLFAEGLVALAESGELEPESFVGEPGRKALISDGNEGNS